MGKFIYLIQGQARLIKDFFYLNDRKGVCALYATYDKFLKGAFFIPNSTWGEGRNFLLKKALELKEEFNYFVFLDDDVRFLKGSIELFEHQLLKYKPAVAVPVFVPKTKSLVIEIKAPCWKASKTIFCFQQCKRGDAQFIAFHRDVIDDCFVMPLQTQFDKISWWFTSSTQQLLILNLYSKSFIQFNNIEVLNELHREYSNNDFKRSQRNWFSDQFVKRINDPRPFAINLVSVKNLKAVLKINGNRIPFIYLRVFCDTIWNTLTYRPKENYHIQRRNIYKIFKKNSEILKQKIDC